MIPDYYALLGVPIGASTSEIKRAYRRLVRQYHPDLHAQVQDTQIKQLNEAYEILSNPGKRAAYDRGRRRDRVDRKPEITWAQGMGGFVRELKKEVVEQEPPAPKITWAQGMGGFVRELRKNVRDD
ncbi:MAG TPA: DnaJ domain-containing protein [Ktedonobacteraceae bacterium]|jgi:curved DNA-binding protein CbpA